MWALVFSTLATIVLQEASGRITVASGRSLGEAIRKRFTGGTSGYAVLVLVLGAIVFGCAAYEAGNILGAVAGAGLGTGWDPRVLTMAIGIFAAALLWLGSPRRVAYILSAVVALMGVVFLATAITLGPSLDRIVRGSLVPVLPAGSGLLVLGLIGTTVVPYNLFLGSGIARGQTIAELRLGLGISVVFGGIISMGIVIVGAATVGAFSYEALVSTLSSKLGSWAGVFFSLGLCAAGFSSAVTAPLAAAVTARGLFARRDDERWRTRGGRYRSIWGGVLLIGIGFGMADVQPIPAIILAQALNGIVLPFAAVFLFVVVNDRQMMGERHVNGLLSNTLAGLVVIVTVVLGTSNVIKALTRAMGVPAPADPMILMTSLAVSLLLVVPVARMIRAKRRP